VLEIIDECCEGRRGIGAGYVPIAELATLTAQVRVGNGLVLPDLEVLLERVEASDAIDVRRAKTHSDFCGNQCWRSSTNAARAAAVVPIAELATLTAQVRVGNGLVLPDLEVLLERVELRRAKTHSDFCGNQCWRSSTNAARAAAVSAQSERASFVS
jgi:hypothetical protein